ncbi:MAG: peptide chain release factor subunit 1 [Gaiellales bacterium]|jgi:peptide subunit release factor 1 (eRF1)|nr:peptide chain release factor subunit 1 [Gaiellales bacterium]
MSVSAAGYLPVGSELPATLRRLAALRPGAPVLSLYLDLDPAEFPTQRARRSAITALLDTAHKQIEDYESDHDGRESLRSDLEHAREFFEEWSPKGARAVAVFSATMAKLFETVPLPRPVPMRAFIGDSPYVTPLVAAADTRDWLIVVVDAHKARLLHGNTEHVEELERVKDSVAGRHEASGPTDHQRWVEHQIDQHLEHVAREVDAHLRDASYQHVIVGGPPEIAPRFESMLSSAARERLAGRFPVELGGTRPDQIRQAALPCFEADERRRERAALDRLTERLGMGKRAVAGADDVRDMLVQRRVEILLFEHGYESADPAGIEWMVEEAIAQDAEILPVRFAPEEVAALGHVAALLRF